MSTLENKNKKPLQILVYGIITVFCFVFRLIYNYFGHGVHSFYMDYLFLWPLLGLIWYGVIHIFHKKTYPLSRNAVGAGIATLTVGSMAKGILEIAGTSSPYEKYFFLVGLVMSIIGVLFHLKNR